MKTDRTEDNLHDNKMNVVEIKDGRKSTKKGRKNDVELLDGGEDDLVSE